MHASVEMFYALDSQAQFHVLQRMFKREDAQNALTETMGGIALAAQPTIETQEHDNGLTA